MYMKDLVLVSDIHGNFPALEAVIDREGDRKKYAVLGDIIGLNAYPKRTVNCVRQIGDTVIGGNHDKAVFEFGEGHVGSDKLSNFELFHTLQSLSVENIEYMLSLSYMCVKQHGNSRVAYTHAYPWPEKASGYEAGNKGVLKRDVTSVASTVEDDYDYVFHGHTHTQYSLNLEKFGHNVHFVNPGCLGYNNEYAVVDLESGDVDLKSVEYDTDVSDHIRRELPPNMPPVDNWYKVSG